MAPVSVARPGGTGRCQNKTGMAPRIMPETATAGRSVSPIAKGQSSSMRFHKEVRSLSARACLRSYRPAVHNAGQGAATPLDMISMLIA